MSNKATPPRLRDQVDQFLDTVNRLPQPRAGAQGRLIFAMDATASRQPTWDRACHLQAEMFAHTRGLGGLSMQLCFYRGYDEFRATPWHQHASDLLRAGQSVRCRGGHTQIERVLRHALREHQQQPLHAVVFIGDCLEESIDDLCQLAGEMGIHGLPLFLFQEGDDSVAKRGFAELARLSGGAHCRFDSHSAAQLGELLNAVAVYASGGREALQRLLQQGSSSLRALGRQLRLEAPSE